MNELQEQAFRGANQGVLALGPEEWRIVILSAAVAVVMLWVAWVLISCYRSWGAGVLKSHPAAGIAIRALLVMLIMFSILN